MNSKYSKFLTVLLVVIVIAIIGIIAFLGYRYIKSTVLKNKAEDFVESWGDDSDRAPGVIGDDIDKPTEGDNDWTLDVNEGENNGSSSSSSSNVQKFNGYIVAGTIEIPKTGLKSPILAKSEYSPSALETSVCEIYGPGLNKVGNTTIMGHNYRNGKFFSNNKKLSVGDKIYIKDTTGKRLIYTIYNKYEAAENESDYMVRDTAGATEISLSTCTDDSKARLIIWARAD